MQRHNSKMVQNMLSKLFCGHVCTERIQVENANGNETLGYRHFNSITVCFYQFLWQFGGTQIQPRFSSLKFSFKLVNLKWFVGTLSTLFRSVCVFTQVNAKMRILTHCIRAEYICIIENTKIEEYRRMNATYFINVIDVKSRCDRKFNLNLEFQMVTVTLAFELVAE